MSAVFVIKKTNMNPDSFVHTAFWIPNENLNFDMQTFLKKLHGLHCRLFQKYLIINQKEMKKKWLHLLPQEVQTPYVCPTLQVRCSHSDSRLMKIGSLAYLPQMFENIWEYNLQVNFKQYYSVMKALDTYECEVLVLVVLNQFVYFSHNDADFYTARKSCQLSHYGINSITNLTHYCSEKQNLPCTEIRGQGTRCFRWLQVHFDVYY